MTSIIESHAGLIFQFAIRLREVDPPVWRRIQVPSTFSFWDLHVAVQDAMGWLDYHLHSFAVTDPHTRQTLKIGIPLDDGVQIQPGWEFRIADVFTLESPRAEYEYDFGDGWLHDIVLESVEPRRPGVIYPRCLDGARACPPEDVGGPWGYAEFLQAISDPDDEQYREYLDWIGGSFNPESFDPSQVAFDDPELRWEQAFGQECRAAPAPVDFQGLTPREVHELLYIPLGSPASPLRIQTDLPDEAFAPAIFPRDCRRYLSLLREWQPLKLTQSGSLPRRLVTELWTSGVLSEDNAWYTDTPPRNAGDSPYLTTIDVVTRNCHLTRKQHGKLLLTRRAASFLDRQPAGMLYRHLFEHYVHQFNWAYLDMMPPSWIVQGGAGFLLYLLRCHGHVAHPASFYADCFLNAFPAGVRDFGTPTWTSPEKLFADAFALRALRHFAARFGLVELSESETPLTTPSNALVQATPLFYQLVHWRADDEADSPAGE